MKQSLLVLLAVFIACFSARGEDQERKDAEQFAQVLPELVWLMFDFWSELPGAIPQKETSSVFKKETTAKVIGDPIMKNGFIFWTFDVQREGDKNGWGFIFAHKEGRWIPVQGYRKDGPYKYGLYVAELGCPDMKPSMLKACVLHREGKLAAVLQERDQKKGPAETEEN